MAVPAGIGRVRYIGAGSTGPFAFNFVLYSTSHLTVTKLDTNGVETTLTLTTDYTVTIAADFSSASVTLINALAGDGIDDGGSEVLTITRDPPIQQLTQWPRNDPFPSLTHERAADLAVMMIGRLNEKIGRSLLLPETTTLTGLTIPNPTPNRAIGWNAAGDNLDNVDVPTMYVQNAAPTGDIPLNSLWIDADSTDYDLYSWDGDSWNDTDVNLKGVQGIQGVPGPMGTSGTFATDMLVQSAGATTVKTTVSTFAGDLDTLAGSVDQVSLLRVATGATNGPAAASTNGSFIMTAVFSNLTAHQTYWEVASNRVWRRVKASGTWGAWGTIGAGKQSIWVPATAMKPGVGGSGPVSLQYVAGATQFDVLAFDSATTEDAHFLVAMPKNWDRSAAVSFQVYWKHASTTTNFAVRWTAYGQAYSNAEAMTGAAFTELGPLTDVGGTTDALYISDEPTGAVIAASEGDLVDFIIRRLGADGADTMAIDAQLIGVKILYRTLAGTDD